MDLLRLGGQDNFCRALPSLGLTWVNQKNKFSGAPLTEKGQGDQEGAYLQSRESVREGLRESSELKEEKKVGRREEFWEE